MFSSEPRGAEGFGTARPVGLDAGAAVRAADGDGATPVVTRTSRIGGTERAGSEVLEIMTAVY
jgi:hypothetical protein